MKDNELPRRRFSAAAASEIKELIESSDASLHALTK